MNNSLASPFSKGSNKGTGAPQRTVTTDAVEAAAVRELDRRAVSRYSAAVPEESLVVDGRSAMTPAQMVESKLVTLLQGSSLPVSHLQMRALLRGRPGA